MFCIHAFNIGFVLGTSSSIQYSLLQMNHMSGLEHVQRSLVIV